MKIQIGNAIGAAAGIVMLSALGASEVVPTLDAICKNYVYASVAEITSQRNTGAGCVYYYENNSHMEMLIYFPSKDQIRTGKLVLMYFDGEIRDIDAHRVYNATEASKPDEPTFEFIEGIALTNDDKEKFTAFFLKYHGLMREPSELKDANKISGQSL